VPSLVEGCLGERWGWLPERQRCATAAFPGSYPCCAPVRPGWEGRAARGVVRRTLTQQELGDKPISLVTMYTLLQSYLVGLPGSMREEEEEVLAKDGSMEKVKRCLYTPHSLRATTATLLLDAGVDIIKVKELLGHKHVTTTQIYDKRRRSLKEGASHYVPI
jgi:integrase